MFCSKCGTEIDDDSRFCNGCGVEIHRKNQDISGRHKHRKQTKGVEVIISFLLIGILGIIWINSNLYTCTYCHGKYLSGRYCSKADESRVFCNTCIQNYYPNSWELYFEKR